MLVVLARLTAVESAAVQDLDDLIHTANPEAGLQERDGSRHVRRGRGRPEEWFFPAPDRSRYPLRRVPPLDLRLD